MQKIKLMKHLKLYAIVAFALISITSFAQDQKKFSVGIGVGLGLNLNNDLGSVASSKSIIFGYRIGEKTVIGAELTGDIYWKTSDNIIDKNTNDIYFSPFAQFYLLKKLYLKPIVGIGYATCIERSWYTQKDKNKYGYLLTTFGLDFGYDINISSRFKLSPSVGYRHINYSVKDSPEDVTGRDIKRDNINIRCAFSYNF